MVAGYLISEVVADAGELTFAKQGQTFHIFTQGVTHLRKHHVLDGGFNGVFDDYIVATVDEIEVLACTAY